MTSPRRWIDTNVMLEVFSQGDLYEAGKNPRPPPAASPDDRRLRIRGSLWMAMALAINRETTISYSHEIVNNILRIGGPESDPGDRTSAVLHCLWEHGAFFGWSAKVTSEGASLTNADRDRYIRKDCCESGRKLISRDRGMLEKAHVEGVDAQLPESYAAAVLPLPAARERFFLRFDYARRSYMKTKRRLRKKAALIVATNLETLRDEYIAIWS